MTPSGSRGKRGVKAHVPPTQPHGRRRRLLERRYGLTFFLFIIIIIVIFISPLPVSLFLIIWFRSSERGGDGRQVDER